MTLIDSEIFYTFSNSIGVFSFFAVMFWVVHFAASID